MRYAYPPCELNFPSIVNNRFRTMTQDLDAMIKSALDGIETLLHAKSVVGDPVTLGEYTLGREQAQ